MTIREAARGQLLAHKGRVFAGVKLVAGLKEREVFDAVGHLVVRGLNAQFAGLVLEDNEIPHKLREGRFPLLGHSTELAKQIILTQRHRELVVFHVPVDGDLSQRLAVDDGILNIREIVELLGVIQKYKSDDRQGGDQKHENALVFAKEMDHIKSDKIID